MQVLEPNDLRSVINQDQTYQRARALIQNKWDDLLLSQPFGMDKIMVSDILFAKRLLAADVVESVKQRFDTYEDIQKFIRTNQSYLSAMVIKKLREPFDV